ncbi:hypothetical protein [Lysinibacillus irui]|uniref:hypothetical protein n=1 Tax=Lysinibacillus irui TaxID=2998077 RepID=UPI002AD4278A|nr:hypothetical protein [Lysinibacillus irui]MEA0564769.1 hypothetical protein [Lysinibacillus irui]
MNKSVCERCDSSINVTIIYVDEIPVTYCKACKVSLFSKKRPVGRPSIGITKKVSLTLTKDDWEQFDVQAKNNRSLFLRKLIVKALNEEDSGEIR